MNTCFFQIKNSKLAPKDIFNYTFTTNIFCGKKMLIYFLSRLILRGKRFELYEIATFIESKYIWFEWIRRGNTLRLYQLEKKLRCIFSFFDKLICWTFSKLDKDVVDIQSFYNFFYWKKNNYYIIFSIRCSSIEVKFLKYLKFTIYRKRKL